MTVTDLLKQTNSLHIPLEIPALEQEIQSTAKRSLPLTPSFTKSWRSSGRGKIISSSLSQIQLLSPTRFNTWPEGAPADGDYIQYDQTSAYLTLSRENWEAFNYFAFTASSFSPNVINPNLTLSFKNEGSIAIPDDYNREGFHSVDIEDNQERTYYLNIADLPRDAITEIRFTTAANGSYLNLPGNINITIKNLQLLKVNTNRHSEGWQLTSNEFSLSQLGYPENGQKIALFNTENNHFKVLNQQNETVYQGQVTHISQFDQQNFGVIDFSDLTQPGTYYLKVGEITSPKFKIAPVTKLYQEADFKILNFIYSERCGFPVPNIHGTCHVDVTAHHNNQTISFNGGWHDAGDLSQQSVHTGEVALSLLQSAKYYRQLDKNFAQRLEEEGLWGLDFTLKTRFGDGYRATSAGVSRWTDNKIDTMDDAQARVHNNPYENYLFAGIYAQAAQYVSSSKWHHQLKQIACEDFAFAQEQFKKTPYAPEPILWEHTYSTSKSTYNATIAWSAGLLFQLTQDTSYQNLSEHFGDLMLDCQEKDGLSLNDGATLKGMFYRDETHRVFQHFNHQSREYLYAQALQILIQNNPHEKRWQHSARIYGDYLLFLQQFTKPYPLIAAGLYFDNETQDHDSFYKQNLLVDKSAEKEFTEQLKNGVQLAPHLYLKRFPVWFSFRGNNGVALAMGRAAAILGQVLKDSNLTQIGINQLQWIVGENPFSQSLIYGLGQSYEAQYSVSSGTMIGEIPVGIETKGNSDTPYWPQFNNATYKEVWISNAGKWLSLVAEITHG